MRFRTTLLEKNNETEKKSFKSVCEIEPEVYLLRVYIYITSKNKNFSHCVRKPTIFIHSFYFLSPSSFLISPKGCARALLINNLTHLYKLLYTRYVRVTLYS